MQRDEFDKQVQEFLRAINAEAGNHEFPAVIGPDDNLFDMGLVTSFSVIRMIVFIEEISGTTIELSDHELERFYTLRGLYDLVDAGEQR